MPFGAYSDPAVSAFLAAKCRFAEPGGFNGGQPSLGIRRAREDDPRSTVRAPSRFGFYHHGYPAPVRAVARRRG